MKKIFFILLLVTGVTFCQSNSNAGVNSLYSLTTGYHDSAFGLNALYFTNTGFGNTGFGNDVLYYNTIGSQNTGAGDKAGKFISGFSVANKASIGSIYLGYGTQALADTDTCEVVIGYKAVGHGDHTVTLGDTLNTSVYLNGHVIATFDSATAKTGQVYKNYQNYLMVK